MTIEITPLVAIGLSAGTLLFTAGAAWGGARMGLNGTRRNVERIDKAVSEIVRTVTGMSARLGNVEGQMEVVRDVVREHERDR